MRTKNYLLSLLAIMMAAVLSVGMTSCSKDDDDPELAVDRTTVNLLASGGTENITVTVSNTDWNATVEPNSQWLQVNKNGQLATITADPNTSTTKRTGKIKITATANASLSKEISVEQAGADGVISVSVPSVEFEADGGSVSIQVTSNSTWSVSGNPSWLTVGPSSITTPSTNGATNVTLTASKNETKDTRPCTLIFTTSDNKGTAAVTVNQKRPEPYIRVNGMESASVNFSFNSGVSYKQTVTVSSNVSWTITNVPDWLSVSPTNGNGENITISIYPKSDNDKEDKERTVQLALVSGETKAFIMVTQDTKLDPDAYVMPTNIVTLYNGIAFDYTFGKNVSYYFRGYLKKSSVASMTDSEIIKILEENFKRYTISDNEVGVFDGLDEGVSYIIYTVGYNKDGIRGRLSKTEFSTKSLQGNEPVAWISDPTTDGVYWHWNTEKNATCNSYYMWATENSDLAFAPDVYQAWLIDYNIRKGNLTEYLNSGSWSAVKKQPFIAVFTWALDKNNKFSSRIGWNFGLDGSSMARRNKNMEKGGKIDANYPIMQKDAIKIIKKN